MKKLALVFLIPIFGFTSLAQDRPEDLLARYTGTYSREGLTKLPAPVSAKWFFARKDIGKPKKFRVQVLIELKSPAAVYLVVDGKAFHFQLDRELKSFPVMSVFLKKKDKDYAAYDLLDIPLTEAQLKQLNVVLDRYFRWKLKKSNGPGNLELFVFASILREVDVKIPEHTDTSPALFSIWRDLDLEFALTVSAKYDADEDQEYDKKADMAAFFDHRVIAARNYIGSDFYKKNERKALKIEDILTPSEGLLAIWRKKEAERAEQMVKEDRNVVRIERDIEIARKKYDGELSKGEPNRQELERARKKLSTMKKRLQSMAGVAKQREADAKRIMREKRYHAALLMEELGKEFEKWRTRTLKSLEDIK